MRSARGGIARLAQGRQLGDDARRLGRQQLALGGARLGDAAHAQARLGVVRPRGVPRRAGQAEPGEEVVAIAVRPGHAAERAQCIAGREAREALARVDRDRDAGALERDGERLAVVAVGRHDEHLVGGQAEPQEPADLGRDGRRLAIGARRLDQPHGTVRTRRGLAARRERAACEGDGAGRCAVGRRTQLLDAFGARGQPFERDVQRSQQRPPGLVREREQEIAAARERGQQAQLRGRQVVEAVGEDRSPVPGGELALEALGGAYDEPAAARPTRLGQRSLVGGVGGREACVATRCALQRAGRCTRAVALAREPLERRGERDGPQAERRPVRVPDAPPHDALEGLRCDLDLAAQHALDQRVERDDLAAEQRPRALAGVAFQRVALERRRHEQQRPRARLARIGEAAEQSAQLARANRPDDELERHGAITRLDGGRLSLP